MTRTVRVRIAVAVNARGKWCAYGDSGSCDEAAEGEAHIGLGSPRASSFVWVEAAVPVPEEAVVQGEVSDHD